MSVLYVFEMRSHLSFSLGQLGDWVCEKMLMARDSSRDETQKLHKKWLKHQAFMAELAQNKEWLDKIEKVSAAELRFSWSRLKCHFGTVKRTLVYFIINDLAASGEGCNNSENNVLLVIGSKVTQVISMDLGPLTVHVSICAP